MGSIDRILTEKYGLNEVRSDKLNGYDSDNYKVTHDRTKYIFKQYKYDVISQAQLVSESKLLHLLNDSSNLEFPEPVPTCDGDDIFEDDKDGRTLNRLLTFVEGDFLAETEHTTKLAYSFGKFLARMDLQMQRFQDPVLQGRVTNWDLQHLLLNEAYISDIKGATRRSWVEYFILQYKTHVLPIQQNLRRNYIHNDANDWNVLVKNGEVSGIIDFGDMVYAPLINELAVALTYIIMGKENPIDYARHVIIGYNDILKLLPDELDVLYYLIAGRLCMSVLNSAHSRAKNPENEYISISEKGAWDLLEKWFTINPIYAANEFRKACNAPLIIEDKIQEELDIRNSFLSKALSISYSQPIKMVGSAFQYMYDSSGKAYLDTYNNIPHVGHCHPHVVAAGQFQMSQLNTNTRYIYDSLHIYAEQLLEKLPDHLNKVFFVNSGSAASDLAIRLAMRHTGYKNIMVMEHGYHGNTRTAIDLSHYKYGGKGGHGPADYIFKTTLPDTYKGKYQDDNAGANYALDAIANLEGLETQVAAFITEPIVGCGGQVPLADGYLKRIYPAVRNQGGVCISDEVQTGFGRLGTHFWGFEMHGVDPDIVILGKPIANGHPMGAVVTTSEISASFETGMEFFSSFGGNPVSCSIAKAVLDVIEEEQLQKNALDVGNYLMQSFNELKSRHPEIGDVRGRGLFIGVELVTNPVTKVPNTALAQTIKEKLKEEHILISTDGPEDNVLKIKPPLCFSFKNADQLIKAIKPTLV